MGLTNEVLTRHTHPSIEIRFYSTSQLEEQGHDIYLLDREIHLASGYLAKITMKVLCELFSGARQTIG